METILVIIWYLIGFFGILIYTKIHEGCVKINDLTLALTAGGLGPIGIYIVWANDNEDKKLF